MKPGMSLHDDLLAAIADRPFCTSRQLGDAVGESDTALVSRQLGIMRKQGLIEKNGQSLWSMTDNGYFSQHAKLNEDLPAGRSGVVAEIKLASSMSLADALDDVERLLNPAPLPNFGADGGIDMELVVLERFIGIMHPEIAAVLERTHGRLVELKAFFEAKAA